MAVGKINGRWKMVPGLNREDLRIKISSRASKVG